MPSTRRDPHPLSAVWALPWWLVLALTPFGGAAAFVVGGAEHGLLGTHLTAALAAANAAAVQGTSVGGGGMLLALLPVVLDVIAVALAVRAFQRGLARHAQMEAGFPLAQLLALGCGNLLCAACSLALGAVTVWASLLAMGLWAFQGPPEYWDVP